MIKEQLWFNYDGLNSKDVGIMNVSVKGGLFEETFVASRKILEEYTKGRNVPYFQGVEYSPLEFDLTFHFKKGIDDDNLRKVANWLCQPYYKPLYFSEYPERIIFCMMEGDSNLVHNGLKDGYVELTMRANSPYVYSCVYEDEFIITGTDTIQVNNLGLNLMPEMYITKLNNNGDVKITNTTNGNKVFEIKNLVFDETVYFDNENRYIESDLSETYRYDDFNGKYMELVYGKNTLQVDGECKIVFKYRYRNLI